MKVAFRRTWLIALGALAATASHQAHATILFDNLTTTVLGGDFINTTSTANGYNNGPLADSFSTGASGFTLNDVILNLGAGTNPAGTITVTLLDDSSGLPGASIATIGTLAESALVGTSANYEFSSFAPVSLTANTRYWIQLTDTNPDTGAASAVWNFEGDATGTDAGSTDLSAEMFYNSNYSANPNYPAAESDTNGPYLMQLAYTEPSSTSTPEPATLAVLGVAFAGLGIARRRRR